MSKPALIADLLGHSALFYRSVALERDAADPAVGRSFVITPWLQRGATEILSGMCKGATRRAWRVIGDFGVGKSALALALVQALDPRISDPAMPLRRIADEIGDLPRLFPLLVTGSRNGLAAELSAAIAAVVETEGLLDSKCAKTISAVSDPFDAIVPLRDALRATKRFDGLLVVVDEMGKFLEAAGETEGFDVFRLQSLAEAAARSSNAPLGVVLILHKGFQSYAESWRTARRSEWEKVAERFEEMVFDHPLSHTAALLSAALAVDSKRVPAKTRKAYDEVAKTVQNLGWLGPRQHASTPTCWPVHPSAIPVMARFFAGFGQNERSLFGFAASEEPNGLRAFAAETNLDGSLYGIHHFFDYVATSFGHRLTSRAGIGEWARIGAVLERAIDADALETAALKVIGLLNLLDAPDLSATLESVRIALGTSFAAPQVDEAIGRLIAGGLVFNRPGRTELRLWTSRRVDLSVIWADAEREVVASDVLQSLPRHLVGLPVRQHILARRHSVETGTNRRFEVRCTHASALAGYGGHAGADGGVVAVLCGNAEDLRIARAWSAEVTSKDKTMLAIALPAMAELGPAMIDLLRHRWIASNAASLHEDAYAAAEIDRTIAELEGKLVSSIETALGLRGHAPTARLEAFWNGARTEVSTPIHAFASQLCGMVYKYAPAVENELVNRNALTTAGAGARQRLIERMFNDAHDEELGFKPGKNPPERALYLSFLRRGQIHQLRDGEWIIAPPDKADPLRLKPALGAMERHLVNAEERVNLPDLYELVEASPYGVRRGLTPLLLAVTLVSAGHRIALFERGTYCARLDGAAFMRILKGPEHFSLQWVALEGVRAEVLHRLVTLLGQPPEENGIRTVVDPLIRFGVDLSFHAQHSSAMGQEAKAVRKSLAQARSPVDLLFTELPVACGCDPFQQNAELDPERAGQFVRRLETAIEDLRSCYPRLLESIRKEVLEALDAPNRAAVAERAARLGFRVREQNLRTFALRLADNALAEDAWTEALGGALVGKPPTRWLDYDVDMWRSKAVEMASQFLRVEAASFGVDEPTRAAVRVSLTRVDGEERAVIVDVGDLNEDQVEAMGAIERMAASAKLSLDKVAALLSLGTMQKEALPAKTAAKKKSRA